VNSDLDALAHMLTRYISSVNARALVLRALRDHGLSAAQVTRRDLKRCSGALRQGIELFVAPDHRDDALRELAAFYGTGGESLGSDQFSIAIRSEADVSAARSEARRLCTRAGADAFTMQKVTTIVSELARNIVLYAQTGTIDIRPAGTNGRRFSITAVDAGPGIPNLDLILSGQYKSKTGLGRGLTGVKRLADRFDISTGNAGTRVVAEVSL
jgi:serine/threonine-protein kinase RsbT